LNKIILAGYFVKQKETFLEFVQRFLQDYEPDKQICGECVNWTNEQILTARRIMLSNSKITTIAQLASENYRPYVVVEVFNLLSNYGLGTIIRTEAANAFERTNYADVAYSTELRKKITSIGLSVHAVLDSLLQHFI
jgi:hypothetical protein